MAGVRRTIGLVLALVAAAGTTGTGVAAQPAAAQEAAPQAWLERLNDVRVGNGLAPAVEEPAWTSGIKAHLDYLRLTPPGYRTGIYANAHYENPDSPYYTPEGDAAGRASILGGADSDTGAIDQWLAAPLHAIGLMRPGLRRVAFARDGYDKAGLDVVRGLESGITHAAPVLFPAPGATTTLHTFIGENPDPLESCGYERSGLPLIALLPEAPTADITAELTTPSGSVLTGPSSALCVVTAENWSSTDPVYGPTGKSVLLNDNAVLVIAPSTLLHGEHRVRLAQSGRPDVTWSFAVDRPIRRLAGDDRFSTAAAVSRSTFPGTVEDVFVVTGTNWPDALSAGPAAAEVDGPVLPVTATAVPGAISTEISRLQPRRAWIIGGPGVVGEAVAADLRARGIEVIRISGNDRFSTAAAVAARFFPSATGAYYASGANYADALGGGAAAAHRGWPLLLTAPTTVPPATPRVGSERIVLGGPAAVSEAVRTQLGARRVSGVDRYSTAAAIARDAFPSAHIVYLATALNFPDALSGAPAAARDDAPLLLAGKGCVTSTTRQAVQALGATSRVVLGGTAVVSASAADLTVC